MRQIGWLRIIAAIGVIVGGAGCQPRSIVNSELYGIYAMRTNKGVDTLQIRADGTYEERCLLSGKRNGVSGRWHRYKNYVVLTNPIRTRRLEGTGGAVGEIMQGARMLPVDDLVGNGFIGSDEGQKYFRLDTKRN